MFLWAWTVFAFLTLLPVSLSVMVNIAWGVVLVTHLLIKWVKRPSNTLTDSSIIGLCYFWIPLSINVGFGGSTKSFLGEDDWM